MNRLVLAICNGFHAPHHGQGVLTLWATTPGLSAIPAIALGDGPGSPLSAHALRQALDQALRHRGMALDPPVDLILWAFSAGCVGAVALAHHWQRYRGSVRALFLVDGWGVTWSGVAPLHRLSHDAFTHHSSGLLGSGRADFVACPGVPHLQMWQSPGTVMGLGSPPPLGLGYSLPTVGTPSLGPTQGLPRSALSSQVLSAADFLTQWSRFYVGLS